MKLKTLLEEYLTTVKSPYHWAKEYVEVFVNPTAKEIRGLKTEGARFIIDLKKKKIYVFEASTIHEPILRALKISMKKLREAKDIFTGYGVIESGKIRPTSRPVPKEKWLEKYLEYKK